jgi:hypothetical protein
MGPSTPISYMTSITFFNKMASVHRFPTFKLSIYSDLEDLSVLLALCFSFSLTRPQKISSKNPPTLLIQLPFKDLTSKPLLPPPSQIPTQQKNPLFIFLQPFPLFFTLPLFLIHSPAPPFLL